MTANSLTTKQTKQAWIVCLTASSFFFYEFIQMNIFNAINTDVMHAFSLDAAGLGLLSSLYFWCSVLFLIPAGTILDRFSAKKLMLFAMLICIIGTFFFAQTHSFWIAAVSRFICGFGSAFCFLSNVRLISRWFPASKQAFMIGLLVTIAMLGGIVAQTPLVLLVHHLGWRPALMLDAALGVLLSIFIILFVQDYPSHKQKEITEQANTLNEMGYWKSLKLALFRSQNWFGGIYTCMLNLPVALFGGIWGTLYLMSAENITRAQSSIATSAILLGTILGSPITGWLSDHLGKRKQIMIVGSLLSLVIISWLLLNSGMGFIPTILICFLLGLVTSTQVISYTLIAETNPAHLTGTAVAIVSMSAMAGYAIFIPIFGWLMDLAVTHQTLLHQATYHYVLSDFRFAIWIFPIGFILSLIASFKLQESKS